MREDCPDQDRELRMLPLLCASTLIISDVNSFGVGFLIHIFIPLILFVDHQIQVLHQKHSMHEHDLTEKQDRLLTVHMNVLQGR